MSRESTNKRQSTNHSSSLPKKLKVDTSSMPPQIQLTSALPTPITPTSSSHAFYVFGLTPESESDESLAQPIMKTKGSTTIRQIKVARFIYAFKLIETFNSSFKRV